MKSFLRFAAKSTLFLALLFCFLVLFQYGPSGLVPGAKSEWQWITSLLPTGGETDMMQNPDASETEIPKTQP
jgi:hypothetical protein